MTPDAGGRDRLLCGGRLWYAADPDDKAKPLYPDVGNLIQQITSEINRLKLLSTPDLDRVRRVEIVTKLMDALGVDSADLQNFFKGQKVDEAETRVIN